MYCVHRLYYACGLWMQMYFKERIMFHGCAIYAAFCILLKQDFRNPGMSESRIPTIDAIFADNLCIFADEYII